MTPNGLSEAMVQFRGEPGNPGPAGRVDQALDMLRADLLERTTREDWDERHANEVAHSIVTFLRQNAAHSLVDARARGPVLSRERLRRALNFINANLDARLDWKQIAKAAGLAEFPFGRRFKLTTGLTPHQYVIRRRIRKAMSLLASSDRRICDIALDVGCSCQSHLTTMFRKHTGTTPRVFRETSNRRLQPSR
jgi:transcriptional regulator GlxA family with amidase domain